MRTGLKRMAVQGALAGALLLAPGAVALATPAPAQAQTQQLIVMGQRGAEIFLKCTASLTAAGGCIAKGYAFLKASYEVGGWVYRTYSAEQYPCYHLNYLPYSTRSQDLNFNC
jgi:hypothetical protein